MRITPNEQEVFKRAAQECFDAAVVVRLFGSHVDDSKKGAPLIYWPISRLVTF